MKKVMVVLFTMVSILWFGGLAKAENMTDNDAKMTLKQVSEAATSVKNIEKPDIRSLKDIFTTRKGVKSDVSFSKDSKDLNPIAGATWIFSFDINGTSVAQFLTFGAGVLKSSDDTVYLKFIDYQGKIGLVFFVPETDGPGSFFGVTDASTDVDKIYYYYQFFFISEGAAGYFSINKNGQSSTKYLMAGMCYPACPVVQTIPGDANEDGKLDVKDIICIFRILTKQE